MTKTLFTNAILIDPKAGTTSAGSLLVSDGLIVELGTEITVPKKCEHVDCGGAYLAPGIVDIGVKVCEPGERHKESYRSAGQAAAAGGVTTIITRPDTTPTIDSPETLEFVTRRAREVTPIKVFAMAALTKGREGREMSEIRFLLDAGAIAFTDCDHVVTDTKVLSRALTYAKSLNALVIGHPQDPGLSKGASVTSGKFASLQSLRWCCHLHSQTV